MTEGIECCPACQVDLIIRRTQFRHTSRAFPVVKPEISAAALYWKCPDCGHAWQRWPAGDRLNVIAKPFIEQENQQQ